MSHSFQLADEPVSDFLHCWNEPLVESWRVWAPVHRVNDAGFQIARDLHGSGGEALGKREAEQKVMAGWPWSSGVGQHR